MCCFQQAFSVLQNCASSLKKSSNAKHIWFISRLGKGVALPQEVE